MKDKKKSPEIKYSVFETCSQKSYEIDPPLKELTHSLNEIAGELRTEEATEDVSRKDKKPTSKEISFFAKEIKNLPELKLDFKEPLHRIATTFSKAFASLRDYEEANEQIQELLIENFFHTASTLAMAVETRDPYTGGHSERVFQIAAELGRRCNLSTIEQLYLQGGALLHDVGKIGIRDGVLLKPGPLTDSEYKEMQLHTIIGAQLVKKLNCLYGCIDVVILHHERIDGFGYPYGIKGKEIPLIARITSIADAYDAMTTNRIYRRALSHEQGVEEIIRNSGTQFDPEIVKVFVPWWEENFQHKSYKNAV
ncbi:MAG: HD-GYP domain-containing protein [Candidatus Melainabacteria bacterium]|nr:HD-GYP domain-containing protein [Candidatus Melainabacteria bacterium]